MVFVNGKSVYSTPANLLRPDVAKVYGKPNLLKTGYDFELPSYLFSDADDLEVRIFALSKGAVASELAYTEGYRWRQSQRRK